MPEATEQMIVSLYTNDVSIDDIAKESGVSVSTVNRSLMRHGILRDRDTGPRAKLDLIEDFFSIIDTQHKAYWLGFIAADGHLFNKNNGSCGLNIRLAARDSDHLKSFRRDIGSEHKLSFGLTTGPSGVKYETCWLAIPRKRIYNDIAMLGINKDKSKSMPMPYLDDSLYSHFIRGYFDGDGSWSVHRRQLVFSIRSATYDFALSLRTRLETSCSLSSNTISFDNGAFRFSYEGNKQCRRISQYLYHDAERFLPRKIAIPANHFHEIY